MSELTPFLSLTGYPITDDGQTTLQSYVMRPYVTGAAIATAFTFAASMFSGQHMGVSALVLSATAIAALYVRGKNKREDYTLARRNAVEKKHPVKRCIDMDPLYSDYNHKDWQRVADFRLKEAGNQIGATFAVCSVVAGAAYLLSPTLLTGPNIYIAMAPIFADGIAAAHRWGMVKKDTWVVKTEQPVSDVECLLNKCRQKQLCTSRTRNPAL